MSQYQAVVYQIVAVRRGQSDAEQRARLGHRPFLIGSGSAADLRLEGEAIRAVQARLFLTTTGQVMLTNLGEAGSLALDGVALPSFACVPWKPGAVLAMGGYDLRLGTLHAEGEEGELEVIEFPVITQESAAVEDDAILADEAAPVEPAVSAEPASPPMREAFASAFGRAAPDGGEAVGRAADSPDRPTPPEGWPLAVVAGPDEFEEADALAAPSGVLLPDFPPRPAQEPAVVEPRPAAAEPAAAAPPAGIPPGLYSTLPKDWQYAGLFGVQLPLPTVSLVPGERVRIPVSLRNGYAEALRLHVAVDGVPAGWVIQPSAPVTVAAGEIQTLDLVLQTRPAPFLGQVCEARIRFMDRSGPNVMLTAALTLSFKNAPNLVGRLEPAEAAETRPVWLFLQNHTQAATEVFITGHAADAALLVVTPQQAQIRLPQGESIQVGVTFRALRRPWLRPVICDYCITVAHSNRAPLDYPGRVRIRPRLWPSWLMR